MKTIKLHNDVEIPIIGSGTNTYGKEGNQYSGSLRGDTQDSTGQLKMATVILTLLKVITMKKFSAKG